MERKRSFLSRGDVDMTTGAITAHLLRFALPLFIGNVFQMLYNTVDTWVVGNFVSKEAFSAVGTVGSALNMMIGLVSGLANGGTVVISQFYGAGRYDKVKTATHTIMLASVWLGIALSFAGVALVPAVLRLMKVPENILPYSSQYLKIMFTYMIFPVIYNIAAAVLRAVGDSIRPFFFLVTACCTNIVLDLLFVIKFNMGVAGVAYATIIAQAVSCVLVIITMLRSDTCIKLVPKCLRIDGPILGTVTRLGIPAALQMTITSFSNIFVQSYINAFGGDCMGGWTAYSKLDQIVALPVQSVSLATATFVGQNLGKNQIERSKEGTRKAIYISWCFVLGAVLLLEPFAKVFVGFFNSDPEVVRYGSYFVRVIVPMFGFFAIYQPLAAAMRGAGNAKDPMFGMLIGGVLFRQVYLFTMSRVFPGQKLVIALAYPLGWVVCTIYSVICYRRQNYDKTRLVKD